jgi:hypothetical protein
LRRLGFPPYGLWVAWGATCVVRLGGDEGEHIRTPGVGGQQRPAALIAHASALTYLETLCFRWIPALKH